MGAHTRGNSKSARGPRIPSVERHGYFAEERARRHGRHRGVGLRAKNARLATAVFVELPGRLVPRSTAARTGLATSGTLPNSPQPLKLTVAVTPGGADAARHHEISGTFNTPVIFDPNGDDDTKNAAPVNAARAGRHQGRRTPQGSCLVLDESCASQATAGLQLGCRPQCRRRVAGENATMSPGMTLSGAWVLTQS